MKICARKSCSMQFEPNQPEQRYCKRTCSRADRRRTRPERMEKSTFHAVPGTKLQDVGLCPKPYKRIFNSREEADAFGEAQSSENNKQTGYKCRGCGFYHVYTVNKHKPVVRETKWEREFPTLFNTNRKGKKN